MHTYRLRFASSAPWCPPPRIMFARRFPESAESPPANISQRLVVATIFVLVSAFRENIFSVLARRVRLFLVSAAGRRGAVISPEERPSSRPPDPPRRLSLRRTRRLLPQLLRGRQSAGRVCQNSPESLCQPLQCLSIPPEYGTFPFRSTPTISSHISS